MTKRIRKAVFPVGGLGTRFLPATKAIPKEMLPVACKPLIQYAYEEALEAGIEQFVFITGRNKFTINSHFDHAVELQNILDSDQKHEYLNSVKESIPISGQFAYVPQHEPAGLGHAVWCARNFIGNEPFAVLLPDEMVLNPGNGLLKQMVEAYDEVGGNIVAVAEVDNKETYKYGILDPANKNNKSNLIKAKGMVEKPKPEQAPSNLSLTGRYILQPSVFTHLGEGQRGAEGEIQLTDAMGDMLSYSDFHGLKFEGERFDCGSQIGFLEANIAYAACREGTKDLVKSILEKCLKRYD